VALVRSADDEGLFTGAEILLSAGGSSYFDLVARGFGPSPGCRVRCAPCCAAAAT
jgi:D-serine dehydratase